MLKVLFVLILDTLLNAPRTSQQGLHRTRRKYAATRVREYLLWTLRRSLNVPFLMASEALAGEFRYCVRRLGLRLAGLEFSTADDRRQSH